MRKKTTTLIFCFCYWLERYQNIFCTTMAECKYLYFKESIDPHRGRVSAVHKNELLPMGVQALTPYACLHPLLPHLIISSLYILCQYLQPAHYHQCLDQFFMNLLATFRTGLIFVRQSKQGVATLALCMHLHPLCTQ